MVGGVTGVTTFDAELPGVDSVSSAPMNVVVAGRDVVDVGEVGLGLHPVVRVGLRLRARDVVALESAPS